jgi:hypothetical protein
MAITSPRIENGRIQITVRSPRRSRWEVLARAALSAVRWLLPEPWLIDLLVLALAATVVGATALYGLAVVSTWTASFHQPTGDRSMCSLQEIGPVGLDACDDGLCCEETK